MAAQSTPCPNFSTPEFANRDTLDKRRFAIFIYVFGQIFLTFCLVVFLWGKYVRRYERIKKRHAILLYSVYLGAMIQQQADSLEAMIGPDNYSCVAKLIINMLIVPFIGAGIVGKLVAFFFRTRFEQQAIEQGKDSRKLDAEEFEKRTKSMLATMMKGAQELFLFRSAGLGLGSLRFLQSGVATMLLFFVVFLLPSVAVGIGVSVVDPIMASGCYGCLQNLSVAVFLVVQSSVSGILTLAALARVRKLPDNFGIIQETLISLVFSAMAIVGYSLSYFLNVYYPIWTFTYLTSFAIWGLVASQTLLQVYIASKREVPMAVHRESKFVEGEVTESQRDLKLSNDPYKLASILGNAEELGRFEAHLAREFGVESLFFFKDASKWAAEYNDVSASTRKARAKHIVRVYIMNDGVFAINVPSEISKYLISSVEQQIDPPLDFFHGAIAEIQDLLERGAVVRFRLRQKQTGLKSGRSVQVSNSPV